MAVIDAFAFLYPSEWKSMTKVIFPEKSSWHDSFMVMWVSGVSSVSPDLDLRIHSGEGFHVTSMATAGSRWGVVMSRNAGFNDQVVELDFLYPSEGIHRRWDSGYRITATAATWDQAALILSVPKRKPGDETQETLRTSAFPSTHVKEISKPVVSHLSSHSLTLPSLVFALPSSFSCSHLSPCPSPYPLTLGFPYLPGNHIPRIHTTCPSLRSLNLESLEVLSGAS
ncbi:hypothetical protein ACLOJK_006623, partial [Asimina triloba]